ncbi:MAG: cellulase family glycosylhydrolase [Deltaproteobacteria bacterium]|nr:cellulase family glycosylhydrolase [Deltaproteobacteria bacterium]
MKTPFSALPVALLLCPAATGCGAGEEPASGPSYALPEAPACAIAPVDPGALRAEGTRLLDAQGRVVWLRGINAGGRSKFAPYSPFDYEPAKFDEALAKYLDRVQAWGMDVLRVPFSWEAAEPKEGEWDDEFLERYDRLLGEAFERGLWTIVDFHQDIYSEAFCGDGFPAWTLEDPPPSHHDCPDWFMAYFQNEEMKAAFDAFWSDATGVRTQFGELWDMMVDRHKGRAGVIGYEVINEPHPGTAERGAWEKDVLGPFYSEYVFFVVTGMQAVSPGTDLTRPEGENIVFAPHFYDGAALMGFGSVSEDVLTPLSVWSEQGDEWDVPVLVGEFGIPGEHPQAAEHARRHYEAFEQLGLHGTWWEYSDSAERWNDEDMSVVAPDGTERTVLLGGMVRPYPRLLAGELRSLRYEPEARRLQIEYAPDEGGVTEIAVPHWLYAGKVRLGAVGACVQLQADRLLVRAQAGASAVQLSIDPAP